MKSIHEVVDEFVVLTELLTSLGVLRLRNKIGMVVDY